MEAWDPGNTGKRIDLIAWEPAISGQGTILMTWEPGNTGKQEIMIANKRAPTTAAIWRRFCAEISYMRPIQARKLKLLK